MKQFSLKRLFIAASLMCAPMFAFAVVSTTDLSTGISSFAGIVTLFTTTVVKAVATLLLSAALVAFFFGIVQYIWGVREGKPDKVKIGNAFIGWGLLALFVMFSVYGIIKFGQGILFNGQDVTTIRIPSFDFGSGSSSLSPTGSGLGGSPTINTGTGGGAVVNSAAQQTYNTCIGNGGTATSCQSAYQAAGGTGNATQNLAQTAYDACISNGNSFQQCQAAYAAYCPTCGVANTGSAPLTGSQTGNTGFDSCIAAGGGVSECRTQYPSSTTGGSSGAYACDPQDPSCDSSAVSAGTQAGINTQITTGFDSYLDGQRTQAVIDQSPTTDTSYADWQTSGNGFDQIPDACADGGC